MYAILKSNIGRRILLLVTVTMLPVMAALIISGWLAVQQSLSRVSNESQALAQATAGHLDYILRQNLERLEGKCGACEFVRVCGGCRARAYSLTGNYMAEEPFCVYQPRALAKEDA